jgi:hypothetical protein
MLKRQTFLKWGIFIPFGYRLWVTSINTHHLHQNQIPEDVSIHNTITAEQSASLLRIVEVMVLIPGPGVSVTFLSPQETWQAEKEMVG